VPGAGGQMIDLDTWFKPNFPAEAASWTLTAAYGLNDNGWITGTGSYDPDGPGDFHRDGTVNAADYVVWRKTDGTPESYNTWRANFGATLGNGVGGSVSHNAVPEPVSLLLFTVAVPSLLGRGRSRSRNLFYCKTSSCQ
jgi:hypothetical protein